MADPITIKLIFSGGATGSGPITLGRNDFTTAAGGRYLTATVNGGSRIAAGFFGVLPDGSIKKVTVSAATHNPNDVVRVETSGVVRTEVDLRGHQQAVTFGPADELVFVLSGRTEVVLIANELSEAEEAAAIDPVTNFVHRVTLRKADGTGFSAQGSTSPTLVWDAATRQFIASAVGAGSIPLSVLNPRESRFEGTTLRVRVTGCEDQTAQVGVTQAYTGDFFLAQTIGRGEWSQPFTLSHDDLLAIESSSLRAGCPAVVADIELLPERPQTAVAVSSASTSPDGSTGVAGEIPFGEWEYQSVNHAGVEVAARGLLMYVRDHNGNSANFFQGTGKGNKAIINSRVLDDMPLGQLSSLDIQYVNRSTGNTDTLNIPYVNLIVDTGSEIKVFVMARQGGDPQLDLLSLSTIGDPQDHRHVLAWNGARVQVVNLLAGVTPSVDLGAQWHDKAYDVSAVLAQYPQARIVRAFPNDNGLPRDTILSGLLINLGDSTYEKNAKALIERVRFNQ